MGKRRFSFDVLRGISEQAIDGLKADMAFCHPAITGVSKIDPMEGAIEVEVHDDLPDNVGEDIERQVANVVTMSVNSYRFVEAMPPFWSHEATRPYYGIDSVKSFTEKHTIELGPGQYAFQGPATKLYMYFCQRIEKLAKDMNAEFWHLPSIEMSQDLIPKTGYFALHPHLVTFGYRLPPHYERIRNFANEAKKKMFSTAEDSHVLEATGFILEPVVCHNIYRSLKNQRLSEGRIITAQGKCYRFEGYRFSPLLRQWEYSMREVVFIGERDFIAEARKSCIELTQAMVDELDMTASLEIATDPFFTSAAASARTFQVMQTAKLELRLRIDEGNTTAAASFNLHDKHFTQPMEIYDTNERVLETACVGWGIERWMAAFVARWSDDPAKWPDFVKYAS
ncbi:MAG: hypothetical protein HZB61_06635 [Nitrospirae bacterium]|nr:hypothetical protein [Nitrospirota bacterium]